MAITRVAQATLVNSSGTGPTYSGSSFTVSSGADRVIVIAVQAYNENTSGAGVSTMSFGTHTLANGQIESAGSGFIENQRTWTRLFVIRNPSAGSSAFSITTNSNHRAMIVQVAEYNGVDQTTGFTGTNDSFGSTASTSVTTTLTTGTDGAFVILSMGHEGNSGTVTAGDGGTLWQARVLTGGTSFNDCSGAVCDKEVATAGSATLSMSWSDNDNTVGQMVELIPASGGGPVTGTLAAQESGADVFTGSGSVAISGTLAAAETGSDIFAASGTVTTPGITGTLAAQETGSDVFSATGAVAVSGALAVQETGADTLAASGTVLVSGSLAAQEAGSDTFTAAGAVAITGTLAAQEVGSDIFSASGVVTAPGIVGTLAAQETGQDTFTGSGTVPISGTLSAQEAGQDTLTATGSVAVTGSLSAQESGSDTANITGSVAITGSLAAQEAGQDVFAASGVVTSPGGIVGFMAAQESGEDTFTATGSVVRVVFRGDDAGQSGAREEFWKRKAEEWLEDYLEKLPKVARRKKTVRKAVAREFVAEAEKIIAQAPSMAPRIDLVAELFKQIAKPTVDYTALATAVAAQMEQVERERTIRRRRRDLEALILLAA